ncbi:ankyrin repeat-containing domain protein, partial [Baffinella frigidus]
AGWTPLHWAGHQGHGAVVHVLLENGAAVSSKTNEDATPLHWASSEGHEAVVQTLLEHGADVSATD